MNRLILILSIAAFAAAASAQTNSKTPATSAPTAKSPAKAATTSTTAPAPTASATEPWIKLPPGVPDVAHSPVKTPFALRYEEITVGTGTEGEAGKIWHLKYTGWRAADGVEFDSWEDHLQPATGPDGKPELDSDGKPKWGNPDPIAIPQGMGRVIPGFDYGLEGMKIGGKRRIFIPWQMAYSTRAMPDRPDRPGTRARHSREVGPDLRRGAGGCDGHAPASDAAQSPGARGPAASRREHAAQLRANRVCRSGHFRCACELCGACSKTSHDRACSARTGRSTSNVRTTGNAGSAANAAKVAFGSPDRSGRAGRQLRRGRNQLLHARLSRASAERLGRAAYSSFGCSL